jgi:hypothetical protein
MCLCDVILVRVYMYPGLIRGVYVHGLLMFINKECRTRLCVCVCVLVYLGDFGQGLYVPRVEQGGSYVHGLSIGNVRLGHVLLPLAK